MIDYYKAGNGANFDKPYVAGAVSAVLALGLPVDRFKGRQTEAQIQACLIRCGHLIGDLDGAIGAKTRIALQALGIADGGLDDVLRAVEDVAQHQFPDEYHVYSVADVVTSELVLADVPSHLQLV